MNPTRASGLTQLAGFTPHMGQAYAAGRNIDAGPGAYKAVSELSPWLAHRLLTEEEVITAAQAAHGLRAAEKFIQEVLWRTYWKGWMQQHPSAWHDYQRAVATLLPDAAGEVAAVAIGHTGIACMDFWARELVETGYLHNHARMWFASIWCFTLRLPWQLGADFFLRHLLDADAASNTLSWRWVAGLQTRGKHYVARAENIARYTNGRFNPAGQLNEAPTPLPLGPPTPRLTLPVASPPPQGRVALLLHENDLLPETLQLGRAETVAVGGIARPEARSPAGCAKLPAAWAHSALADGMDRAALHFGIPVTPAEDVVAWADAARCDTVITPYAPVGWTADRLAAIEGDLIARRKKLIRISRPWDKVRWPHANGGFFAFWSAINR